MTSDPLENLVSTGNLDRIPASSSEFDTLVNRGRQLLLDAQNEAISIDGRFSLIYRASHCLCTAALRWHGLQTKGKSIRCISGTYSHTGSSRAVNTTC